MTAPLPASPESEPIAAPPPAPSRPPDTMRSSGVVPQADSAKPVAKIAAIAPLLRIIFFIIVISRVAGVGKANVAQSDLFQAQALRSAIKTSVHPGTNRAPPSRHIRRGATAAPRAHRASPETRASQTTRRCR